MDSPHHNWLGFSLSNHRHVPSEPSDQLCLFEAFTTATTNSSGFVLEGRPPEESSGATDLSIFTGSGCCGGPKLEDFLGGCGSSVTGQTDLCQFNNIGDPPSSVSEADDQIYDSELKSIAASFLRGYSTEQAHHAENQQLAVVAAAAPEPAAKKALDTFGQRTSIYRGVTRHRWTGRYEAHLWDNSCRREGQSRKGRQGGYDKEDKAARAYDLAALKYWGPTTTTNFPVSNYERELEEMKNMTRQEFVASLRRKSSGFSRGASIYRGVTRHHQHGRWQARIGRVAGNKDLYLGTFSTQEEAAEAYDIAAIKFRGLNAVTNFDMSRYDVKSIASSNLPVGGITGKSKNSSEYSASDNKSLDGGRSDDMSSASSVAFAPQQPVGSTLSFALPFKHDTPDYWSILGYPRNPGGSTASNTQFQGTTPFSMDFSAGSGSSTSVSDHNSNYNNNDHNNGYYFNGGNYFMQQSIGGTASAIPFATPNIALNSNNTGNSYEGSSFGNWVAPSLHSFQPAKPNLSVFQTPIFGME